MTIESFCLCFILANIITGIAFAFDDYMEYRKREKEEENDSKRNTNK